jgi:hypothetical protein
VTDYQGFKFLYVGSVKGIQEYIFRVSKLKYIIGATELIEGLGNELTSALDKLGMESDKDYCIIQLAGGNARLLFREREKALQLMELWPFLVRQYAPGVKFVQALVERTDKGFKKAMDDVETEMRANRNINIPDLPPAEPVVGRHRRTGLPLGSEKFKSGGDEGEEPYPDRETLKKLQKCDETRETLAGRIGLEERWPDKTWVREFSRVAPNQGQYMAVIHADANKLGKTITDALEHIQNTSNDNAAIAFTKALTRIIEEVTQESLVFALEPIVDSCKKKEVPVRVIVCAGDDMTVVMPAADAPAFAERYLETFRNRFSEKVRDIAAEHDVKLALTAAAGIAFVKPAYPFAQAYQLCEEMCSYAKKQLNRDHSGLAFHRITTSGVQKYDAILASQLMIPAHGQKAETRTVLNMMPYTLESETVERFASVSDLMFLVNTLGKMPRGSVRELISAMYRGKAEVDKAFKRILQVLVNRKEKKQVLVKFQEALERFRSDKLSEELIWAKTGKSPESDKSAISYAYTPLMDALELMAVSAVQRED